jgi:KUP system potassium uptake protein
LWPLIGLATCATVIASQAVISGVFSLTGQAIQLGYLPRMKIIHTSATEIGQVYLPRVNWLLMVGVLLLVFGFGSSGNLAAAYGISVTGAMAIDAVLVGLVAAWRWGWGLAAALVFGAFLAIDLAYFGANALKIPAGGWFRSRSPRASLTSWSLGAVAGLRSGASFTPRRPPSPVSSTDSIPG